MLASPEQVRAMVARGETPTPQEVFDAVATHLRRQGHRSMRYHVPDLTSISCAYRGTDGDMCAVGALVPDQLYAPAMEGSSVSALVLGASRLSRDAVNPQMKRYLLAPHMSLLVALQAVHDQPGEHEELWMPTVLGELRHLAEERDLNPAAIDAPLHLIEADEPLPRVTRAATIAPPTTAASQQLEPV